MAKKRHKQTRIVVTDIKTFGELSAVLKLVNEEYGGYMPLEIYKGFLKRITNRTMRDWFILKFEMKIRKEEKQKTDIIKQTKPCPNIKISSKKMRENEIVTVDPIRFSFKMTEKGPRLVYDTHMCIFYGKKEWFHNRVLRSINRRFQIRINDCTGFSFIPYSDKYEFAKLLEQKCEEVQTQTYNEELNDCIGIIDKYIKCKVAIYIGSYRHFVLKMDVKDFMYDEKKQIYVNNTNIINYLNISKKTRFHIPLQQIIGDCELDDYFDKYNDEITAKLPDGFTAYMDLTEIFPNLCNEYASIIIPKIFIERLGSEESFKICIDYIKEKGTFSSNISDKSWCRLDCCRSKRDYAVFPDTVKKSLINIMSNINDSFIIMFYSAFRSMFHDNDSVVQSIYDKEYEKIELSINSDDYVHYWKLSRYQSGFSPLICFDTNNVADWMWLTAQVRNGIFLKAFSFYDKDLTYSMEINETKTPVKVYLAVQQPRLECNKEFVNSFFPDNFMVSMYALDTTKSIYRFSARESNVEKAIFFIWSYFSSNYYNKRLNFERILRYGTMFGINYFYKDPPLEYVRGIGYYDPRLPMII